jgi:hypothetical protein
MRHTTAGWNVSTIIQSMRWKHTLTEASLMLLFSVFNNMEAFIIKELYLIMGYITSESHLTQLSALLTFRFF